VNPSRISVLQDELPVEPAEWRGEVEEFLESIGRLGVGSFCACEATKPCVNAKPKGFKTIADLGIYDDSEIDSEPVKLPTLDELTKLFKLAEEKDEFRGFVEAIKLINRADMTIIGDLDIEGWPSIDQLEKGVTEKQALIIFAFWDEDFDKESYGARFERKDSESTAPKIETYNNGLVQPSSAVADRHEYLRKLKAIMFVDAINELYVHEKALFRNHRNAVLDADPECVEALVRKFYLDNAYLRERELPGKKLVEEVADITHPVVREKVAIDILFKESNGGGAGVKRKPSVRKVILSENQKKRAELGAIYKGNKRYYDGYEDEPEELVARRVNAGKVIRHFTQNTPGVNVDGVGKKPKSTPANVVYSAPKPKVFLSVRGLKRTVSYL